MEAIVRELLAELSTPPVLVYPNWDGVTDNFLPFLLYGDTSVDGFLSPKRRGHEKITASDRNYLVSV